MTVLELFKQMNAGRPKDLEKRKRILDAAKILFLECGYHGCSMNKIAQQAEVTKLTVYNHFQDKETLFTSAIAETCESLISASPIDLSPQSDFKQELYHACEFSLSIVYLPEALKMDHLLLELASQQNPLAQQFYQASHQKLLQWWDSFLAQAADLKFIDPASGSRQQVQLIFSLLLGMRHQEIMLGLRLPPDSSERQHIIQECISLFMYRYGAPD